MMKKTYVKPVCQVFHLEEREIIAMSVLDEEKGGDWAEARDCSTEDSFGQSTYSNNLWENEW